MCSARAWMPTEGNYLQAVALSGARAICEESLDQCRSHCCRQVRGQRLEAMTLRIFPCEFFSPHRGEEVSPIVLKAVEAHASQVLRIGWTHALACWQLYPLSVVGGMVMSVPAGADFCV